MEAAGFVLEFSANEGLGLHDRSVINLIIEELVTNTLNHGNADDNTSIIIELKRASNAVAIGYQDAGIPFDPHHDLGKDDRHLPLEQRSIGGLGWRLILDYCERVDYQRQNGQNKLALRTRLDHTIADD
jgi:sigma-B regulation protein RsbU (phosphoserine phosphatase)